MRESLRLGVLIVMLSTIGIFLAVALWRMAMLDWRAPFVWAIFKEAALETGQVLIVGVLILYFLRKRQQPRGESR